MEETRNTRLSRADVREALMWAIEHDHAALLAHRAVAHTDPSEFTRRRADITLVKRWLDATGGRGEAPAS